MAGPRFPTTPEEYAIRLWNRIEKRGPNECWPWLGALSFHKYGQFWMDGINQPATRCALVLTGHPMPKPGMHVLHSCDNPPCCNPAHLRWGTMSENMLDKWARGRGYVTRGERNGNAKITDVQRAAICELDGQRSSELVAPEFNISAARVRQIWGQNRGQAPSCHNVS